MVCANSIRARVLLAQLVERSLPTPQVHGSNPVVGNLLYVEYLFTINCIEKTKIKNNRPAIKKTQYVLVNRHPVVFSTALFTVLQLRFQNIYNLFNDLQRVQRISRSPIGRIFSLTTCRRKETL